MERLHDKSHAGSLLEKAHVRQRQCSMTKNLYGNISMALLKSPVVPQYIMTYSHSQKNSIWTCFFKDSGTRFPFKAKHVSLRPPSSLLFLRNQNLQKGDAARLLATDQLLTVYYTTMLPAVYFFTFAVTGVSKRIRLPQLHTLKSCCVIWLETRVRRLYITGLLSTGFTVLWCPIRTYI